MVTIVTIFHIIACMFLIGVVLLQQGKGADMGAVFGGSSSTIFGSSGAGNFLTRLTTAMAIIFMLTSLTLTYSGARRVTSTVFDSAPLPEPPPLTAPQGQAPEAPAAGNPAAAPAPQPQAGSEAAPQAVAPQAAAPQAAAPDGGAPQAAAPQAAPAAN
jgi:preprotein translocase subunit SecG